MRTFWRDPPEQYRPDAGVQQHNSLALEQKFEAKTRMRFERVMQKNNATILKAVKLEIMERERTENACDDQAIQVQQTQQVQQAQGNVRKDDKDTGKGENKVTASPTTATPQTAEPAGPPDDAGRGRSKKADDSGGSGGSPDNGSNSGGSGAAKNQGQGGNKNR